MLAYIERSWLEQGHNIGEEVVPLARSFNDTNMDLESGNSSTVSNFFLALHYTVEINIYSEMLLYHSLKVWHCDVILYMIDFTLSSLNTH